jgi:hypothetical protein
MFITFNLRLYVLYVIWLYVLVYEYVILSVIWLYVLYILYVMLGFTLVPFKGQQRLYVMLRLINVRLYISSFQGTAEPNNHSLIFHAVNIEPRIPEFPGTIKLNLSIEVRNGKNIQKISHSCF